MQVAGEDASVGELLGRDAAVDGDHERLEQPLRQRLAEEEVARLLHDRQLEAERSEESRRVVAGRDDDGVRGVSAGSRFERPAGAVARDGANLLRDEPRAAGDRRPRRTPRRRPADGRSSRPRRSTTHREARPRRARARARPPRRAARSATGSRARAARPRPPRACATSTPRRRRRGSRTARAAPARPSRAGRGSPGRTRTTPAPSGSSPAFAHCWRTPPGWMPDAPEPTPAALEDRHRPDPALDQVERDRESGDSCADDAHAHRSPTICEALA